MDHASGTTEGAAPQAPDGGRPGGPEPAGASPVTAGFGARGRARRRARFLRKARELAYRDLGGLVFNLHRFGQRNDELVLNKLTTLGHIDAELRTLETALGEHDTVTVLREAGITACPRCAAIHSGDDRFCPNCGLSMSRHVELPIAGTPPPGGAPTAAEPAPAASPGAVPRAGSTPAGGATASWPTPSPRVPDTAAGGQTGAPASAGPTPSPASAPGESAAPARGAAPAPPPAPAPDSDQQGAQDSGPTIGRSPRPPSERARAASGAGRPGTSLEEDEQTEILHPVEPDK